MRPLLERFSERYVPEPNTGCWLWIGSIDARVSSGYGLFGKNRRAHRVSWELHSGAIPDGLVVDHICRVRSCVNPDHLRIVTRAVNNVENSHGPSAKAKQVTHCPKGHPYAGENLHRQRAGRKCRTCHRLICNAYRLRRRLARTSHQTSQ